MNILFLSIGPLSHMESNGIYTDLLREFKNNGHSVTVIGQRERRLGLPTERSEEAGINVIRVKTGNITKVNLIEKGISTLLIEYQYLNAIKKYLKDEKFDLVLYTTPPITFAKVIQYIKKTGQAKSYLLLKDIFPQNAVDLGMFSKKSIFYKIFRQKEIELYKQSDYIGCMSEANVQHVIEHNPYIDAKKIEVCPNSIQVQEISKDDTQVKAIKQKYGIPQDKCVCIYGGNLGKPQGIDFLIECIKANKDNQEVFFLIVGSGTEYNKIENFMNSEQINNAKLYDQLPKEEYEVLANSCDVGLIFLDKRFTIPNFPSRLLSYMQASIPVLAATDVNTDIGQVITDGGFGFWAESGNLEAFNKQLDKLTKDKEIREDMGIRGNEYLQQHYTVENSYEIIMKHFK